MIEDAFIKLLEQELVNHRPYHKSNTYMIDSRVTTFYWPVCGGIILDAMEESMECSLTCKQKNIIYCYEPDDMAWTVDEIVTLIGSILAGTI